MFLYILNKEEGQAFIELAYFASKMQFSDEIISKANLETYMEEIHMSGYVPQGTSISDIISILCNSTKPVKRSVIIELCGFIHSGNGICEEARNWIYSISDMINMERNETDRLIRWSNDFSKFLQIGLMYINAK